MSNNNVSETLVARGARYGKFEYHAETTQRIKAAIFAGRNSGLLNHSQREALEMIAHKIGRIVEGDPNYADSWHDIAGYAKLVDDELTGVDSNSPGPALQAATGEPVAAPKSDEDYQRELIEHTFGPIAEVIFMPKSYGGTD